MLNSLTDPKDLGVDILIGVDGDFLADRRDFTTIEGEANVTSAFIRELATPYGRLARFVYDVEGLKVIDESYGNTAFALLSEPVDAGWIDSVQTAIYDVAAAHERIELIDVSFAFAELAANRIRFIIKFRVVDGVTDQTASLVRTDSTFLVGLDGG